MFGFFRMTPSDTHDNKDESRALVTAFLRAVRVFQVLVAAPFFLYYGLECLHQLFGDYPSVYRFIFDLFSALLAGSIVAVAVVQHKLPHTSKRQTERLELIKCALATVTWTQLVLDAMLRPEDEYYRGSRGTRIAITLVAVLVPV